MVMERFWNTNRRFGGGRSRWALGGTMYIESLLALIFL
jgi:hypothetical protein